MTEIEQLGRALESIGGIRLAVLFGSAARGVTRPTSDLDVGVLLEPETDLLAMQVAIERATERAVDLVALDQAPPLLRFEIARDGVVLIERQPWAWSDFRARAMIDWWDWAPTVQRMHEVMRARLREEAARGPA